jgi:capsular polysaccharide biosynthesis protein
VLAFALAGLAAGVALALAVTAATDEVYRARALLQAVPQASTGQEPGRAAEVAAATYAGMADSRGFLADNASSLGRGGLSPSELVGRLDARHREGSALVEIVARDDTRESARMLADDLAAALVAHVEKTARQRAARIEADLRPRIDQLSAAIAELESTAGSLQSAATADRLRSLRAERAAFQARLAGAAETGAGERFGLVLAAPASADPNPIRPRRALNLFGGVLLGLVAGLGSSLLVRRRPPGVETAPVIEPERAAGVQLLSPAPGAELFGQVVLAGRSPGAASLELLVSDGSADWHSIATAEGDEVRVDWDAAALEPGDYWLCVVARDPAGEVTSGAPVPVTVPTPSSDAPARAATS